jgi:hypothetical protein
MTLYYRPWQWLSPFAGGLDPKMAIDDLAIASCQRAGILKPYSTNAAAHAIDDRIVLARVSRV